MNIEQKHHLYYWNDKIKNSHWDFIAWKMHTWWWPRKIDEDKEKENKDYSYMKSNFSSSLKDMEKKYNHRYNWEYLAIRKDLKIEPTVLLKINCLNKQKLTWYIGLFKSLWMNYISYDETISEYTLSLNINEYKELILLINNFILRKEWEEFEWKENILKLFSNFSLLSSEDRTDKYYDYLNTNSIIYISTFDNKDIYKIKESLLILKPSLKINIDNNKIIINSWILNEHDIEIISNCFDNIKKVYSSNMKFKVTTNWKIINEELNLNIWKNILSETICIVDSWIEQVKYLKDYIEYDKSLNYSHISKNPLEDSKKLYDWHWTNVAWIAIFWKQIHQWIKDISPICKVCSLQIIDSSESSSIDFLELVNGIRNININSWWKIKIFNLSFSTEILSKNSISSLASYLDNLMHEHDIICVISTGNNEDCEDLDYPMSWINDNSFITSPAESINWITVWSIWHTSLWENYVSYYTRKDNIKYPNNYSEKVKKYRKKPDILVFWWNKKDEFRSLWPNWNIVEFYGTSFATPYVTHLLVILKNIYKNVSMISLKALLLNRANNVEYTESVYSMWHIDHNRLYWHWTILDKDINDWSFALSNDDKVTILIESEFDFWNYKNQHYPFLTTKIKMPELKIQKSQYVNIKATLCYNPLVNLTDKLCDYNTCFLWFKLHLWDNSLKHNKYKEWDIVTELTWINWERWSWTPSNNSFWNNTQNESFTLTKNQYNNLIKNDLAITIKAILKKNKSVIDYYKENKQKFSLVITVEDWWKEWLLYEYIKNNNSLETINENESKIKANLKI